MLLDDGSILACAPLEDSERVEDLLNPLKISQIAIICSCTASGIINKIANTAGRISNECIREAIIRDTALKRPQIDNHRGMSFVL